MKVEQWPVNRVKPYHSNPRKNDASVALVAKSIQTFGFRQPIVVDKDGVIVVGHTRYAAALLLKMEFVPVHVAEDLSPEAIRAYRLADNKVAESSEWDYDLLRAEIGALQIADFDLAGYGWSDEEFEKIMSGEDGKKATNIHSDACDLTPQYSVIVECDSEETQGDAYNRITEMGYKCKCTML